MCNFTIAKNFLHVLWLVFKFFKTVIISLKHAIQNNYVPNWLIRILHKIRKVFEMKKHKTAFTIKFNNWKPFT